MSKPIIRPETVVLIVYVLNNTCIALLLGKIKSTYFGLKTSFYNHLSMLCKVEFWCTVYSQLVYASILEVGTISCLAGFLLHFVALDGSW